MGGSNPNSNTNPNSNRLVQDPAGRLGTSGGAKEVQAHPFFLKPENIVNLDHLNNNKSQSRATHLRVDGGGEGGGGGGGGVAPPFVPELTSSEDTSYFNAPPARSEDLAIP